MIQKIVGVSFLLVFTGYFLMLLSNAFQTQHISEGWENIKKNPWAYSAFVDYLAGLVLSVPYMIISVPSIKLGSVLGFCLIVFGNPILILTLVVRILLKSTIQEAFLPFSNTKTYQVVPSSNSEIGESSNPSSLDNHQPSNENSITHSIPSVYLKILKYITIGMFFYYTSIVVYALSQESIQDGWQYIKQDVWSFVTFIDNLLGITFTAWFIAIKEGEDSPLKTLVWLVSLLLFGNGVTCTYVILKLTHAHQIKNALFTRP